MVPTVLSAAKNARARIFRSSQYDGHGERFGGLNDFFSVISRLEDAGKVDVNNSFSNVETKLYRNIRQNIFPRNPLGVSVLLRCLVCEFRGDSFPDQAFKR